MERRSPYLQRSSSTRGYVRKERNDGLGRPVLSGQGNLVECVDQGILTVESAIERK